jgi:hypothetical protein
MCVCVCARAYERPVCAYYKASDLNKIHIGQVFYQDVYSTDG